MNTDTGFYRDLEPTETLLKGDEYLSADGNWKPSRRIGCLANTGEAYRRPVTPTPEPEYRMLEPHEIIQVGDQWRHPDIDGWVAQHPMGVGFAAGSDVKWRRPVTPRRITPTLQGWEPHESLTPLGTPSPATLNPTDPKGSVGATKCPLHLLPVAIMEETAWVLKGGAEKYGIRNYRYNTVCASTYISAIMRHLNKWREREDLDTESGRSHLAHIAANCAILMDAAQHGTLEDDRA